MTRVLRVPKDKNYDLFAFVADVAMQNRRSIPIQCNCGGETVFNPPFEEDAIKCSACGASIGLMVIEGDPGYVLTHDARGNKQLGFVHGGSAKPVDRLSKQERERIIRSLEGKQPPKKRELVWIETPVFMGWGCNLCTWKYQIPKTAASSKLPSPETRDAFLHHRCAVLKHEDVRWNKEIQEWFCVKCGRTSDHTQKGDALVELEQYECELPTVP